MTSASDETIQIYNVKEGRHEKSLLSKKYGVKLAKFTHTNSSIIYASTKQNSKHVVAVPVRPCGQAHPLPNIFLFANVRDSLPGRCNSISGDA